MPEETENSPQTRNTIQQNAETAVSQTNSPQTTELIDKSISRPERKTYSADEVEKILNAYLGEHQTSRKIFQLLIDLGVYDLLANGLTRLAMGDIQDDMQADFLRDHILMRNWTTDQVNEIDEELADLNKEIDMLKEEQQNLEAEWEDYLKPRPEPPTPVLQVTPSRNVTSKLGSSK